MGIITAQQDTVRDEQIGRAVYSAQCAIADLRRLASESGSVGEALRLYYLIRDEVEQDALKAAAAALDRADAISERAT